MTTNATPHRLTIRTSAEAEGAPNFSAALGWLWHYTRRLIEDGHLEDYPEAAPILDLHQPDRVEVWWPSSKGYTHYIYLCVAAPVAPRCEYRATVGVTRGLGHSFVPPLRGACHARTALDAAHTALVSAYGASAWQNGVIERGAPDPSMALWVLTNSLRKYEDDLP
jgi:hypothetical protein